jgi:probable rRNA maturation factor
MAQPQLTLSLQFARDPQVAPHREALPRSRVARWIRAALAQHPAEITVRIVGLDEGRALNRDYRHKDYATNVLTFDYARPPEAPVVAADLVLCAPVVEKEAQDLGISLQAHYAHMLVHGTLHAQGHDHVDASMAEEMEALETAILKRLGFDDPYMPSP